MIIDSHCHLTYEPMASSIEKTIINANKKAFKVIEEKLTDML